MVRNDIGNKHIIWYQDALVLAITAQVSESKPCTCFKISVKENHPLDTVSQFYKMLFTRTVVDEVYGQLKRHFTGDNNIVFEGLYIIPNMMIYSRWLCWRSKLKNFLKLYKGCFDQVSMKTLGAELDFWKQIGVRVKRVSLIMLVQHYNLSIFHVSNC